LGELLAVGK